MGARIISVCDAYHAMTTDRPYRKGMSTAAAIAELRREAGHQFDPRVIETFCALTAGRLDGAGEPPRRTEPLAVVDPPEVTATTSAKPAPVADPAKAAIANHR